MESLPEARNNHHLNNHAAAETMEQIEAPPAGFEAIEATLEALEHELRDRIKETNERKRKTESMWPVHQIGWQKSRYVYDMFYTYKRISRPVYEYCLRQKLVDAALIAKWKKPGYERLCSTYVINPTNYKFGTTSICRVPMKDRGPEQKTAVDPTTGCLGCASGPGAGPKNIFGNKYGQYLAAVQVAREARIEGAKEQRRKEEEERKGNDETDDDSDTDSGGDDDGVWAGSGRVGTRDESDSETEEPIIPPSAKRART